MMSIDEAVAQEERHDKIADYVARGAEQRSRKYRMIGVPPVLAPMQTYLDVLLEKFPDEHDRLMEGLEVAAKRRLLDLDKTCHVTLTHAEFDEWLVQHGCRPNGEVPR